MRIKNATSWKLAGVSALALGMLAVPAQQAAADVLADYEFTGTSAASGPTAANSTADDIQNVGADTGFSSSGNNAFMRSQSLAGADEAAAITAGVYFSFTVTPDSGYELDLTSLTFTSIHNATNNSSSLDPINTNATMNFFVRSSVDSFASTVGSVFSQAWNSTTNDRTIDLSGAAFQDLDSAVTFRLYVYENPAVDTNQGARWDNVVLNGSVALVPEPGSLALMGLGGLCLLKRRRRG